MSKGLLLVCAAGCCLSSAAFGQALEPAGDGMLGPILKIDHNGNVVGEMSVYEARAVGFTYRNNIFDSAGYWNQLDVGNRHNLEDINFTPGPWSTGTTHSFSRVQFSLFHVGTTPSGAAGIQYKIWSAADCNFLGFTGTGTSMINPNATPVVTFGFTLPTGLNQNAGYGFNPIDMAPVTIPAGNYYIEAAIVNPTTGADLGTDMWRLCACTSTHAPANGTTPGNPASIGATLASLGYDINDDGIFTGAAAAATGENRQWGFNVNGQFWNIGLDIALGGDITATAPSCTSLAMATDNVFATDTAAYTAAGVKWYCVAVGSDAVDANNKYIDIDTEGSAVDSAIALYKSDGTLVAKDEDSGSGTNAQLSFGMGRRAAVGDGNEYDGRNWDGTGTTPTLGLAAGTYYVAVAASGLGATFSDGFTAVGNGTAGNITVRVRGNTLTGALDPSVAPLATRITGSGSEDPIVAPGGQILPAALGGPGVLWYDVNLCSNADANNTVTFDTTGTTAPQFSITLFDGNGNLAGQGTGTSTTAAIVSFGGAGAGLPAGHYYIALTYDTAPDVAANAVTAGRWHLRGRNGSQGYDFSLAVIVPWNSCGPVCGSADFNCDGDTATDQDIEAFFACLAGNCPAPPCTSNADFNGDGDVATDADIEAFFRVLAGGSC